MHLLNESLIDGYGLQVEGADSSFDFVDQRALLSRFEKGRTEEALQES